MQKSIIWAFAATLLLMTTALAAQAGPVINAETVIVVNKYGMTAPFLLSWAPVWLFAFAGGIGSIFFIIPEIDKHFRHLWIAKPFLGLFGGMSLCLLSANGGEPPEIALTAYALIAGLLSAPILQVLITIIMIPKNQAGLLNSINPFKFKIVATHDDHDPGDKQ